MAKTHTLRFDDNALLVLLYGEQNAHLRYIEDRLAVEITSRGETINISGNSRAVQKAADVLEKLWSDIKNDKPVTIAEIDAALRFANDKTMSKTKKTKQSDIVIQTRSKDVVPRSPAQAAYIQAIQDKAMVFGLGPAGTGKTYLAVAAGVSLYLSGTVRRLIFCRPALEAGERLGFLPGDLKEKIDPYLRPIYDALHDMMPQDMLEKKMIDGDIEIAPLAFMRGRTLSRAFVLLDEGQNTTSMQMRMFLTRMGEASRMVITGDMSQTDLPPGTVSGLREARDVLEGIDDIAFVRFDTKDVVRHALVGKIIRAYAARQDA